MDPIARILRRLREAQSANGAFHGLLLAPIWLIRRRYLVFEMNLSRHPEGDSESFSHPWEQLTGASLAEIRHANPHEDTDSSMARENEGQICFAWKAEGKVIHYRWYATRPTRLAFLELTWSPEDGDYTVLGAFTHPEFRGLGIHTALVQQGLVRARALGLRRIVSFIAEWNTPSIRAVRGAGLRQSGTVTLWKLGLSHIHSRSGSAKISGGRLRIEHPHAQSSYHQRVDGSEVI